MLQIEQSNRLEVLAERLQEHLCADSAGPLRPRVVVVPNPGMGRWLAHHMAGTVGIAANLDLPLPASFFWRVLRAWLPDAEASPFEREVLSWRIQRALIDGQGSPALATLDAYLDGDDPALRRFQLAERIADVFDQYLVFRPDMVLAWEQGEGEGWQPVLWRAVTTGCARHRARLMGDLLTAMDQPPKKTDTLPETTHFFGLNALAPVYLDILCKLTAHQDLYLYHLNPCREYWADIRSEKSLAHHENPQEAFLEVGNPLLASWGHVGQVFLDQLLSLDMPVAEHFQEPSSQGVLAVLQRDILCLQDGREQPLPLPDESWPSLQFHSSHTPLREVQVLHDNLLRCLEELDDLKPRDILVMAPDMAAYAPFVESVFGTADGERAIPFSIGDRSPAGENALADAVLWLLDLPASRFAASELLALLEVNAVRQRFDLDAEALERIRDWIQEGGIRWGVDADHRQALGLAGEDGLNTWRFGLHRLFLGYVTPANRPQQLFADGTVPLLDIEGGELPWAGALQDCLERLDHWRRELAGEYSLSDWQDRLLRMLDDFFVPAENEEQRLLQGLKLRLDELVKQSQTGGFDGHLSLSVLRSLLGDALSDTGAVRGFLDGGVTFSNLLPMRALPFRVIALLGMNDDAFPRRLRPPSFDLMTNQPRRGDRNSRRDDRYLFLETLVSARDTLFISWQGRDARSNQPRLPAEPVSELLDYLGGRFDVDADEMHKRLLLEHPLQPFSRYYFDGSDSRLFSYDPAWCLTAGNTADKFDATGLGKVELPEVIEPVELMRFFRNPARVFLQQTLGMRLPEEVPVVEDTEPFSLDSLAQWQLGDRLIKACLDKRPLSEEQRRLRGEGRLPHGLPGELEQGKLVQTVTGLHERLAAELEANPWLTPPLTVDLTLGGLRLCGPLPGATASGVLYYRIGKLRGQDRLEAWIGHLIYAVSQGEAMTSRFVVKDETMTLNTIRKGEAQKYLQDLLALYCQGLRQPLKFFPKTAWKLVAEGKYWKEEWRGSSHSRGEREDSAWSLVFRGVDPLDCEFQDLAHAVYGPLKAHLEKAS